MLERVGFFVGRERQSSTGHAVRIPRGVTG
jgi:hypothetical protein